VQVFVFQVTQSVVEPPGVLVVTTSPPAVPADVPAEALAELPAVADCVVPAESAELAGAVEAGGLDELDWLDESDGLDELQAAVVTRVIAVKAATTTATRGTEGLST
jgi:hypothetical protein